MSKNWWHFFQWNSSFSALWTWNPFVAQIYVSAKFPDNSFFFEFSVSSYSSVIQLFHKCFSTARNRADSTKLTKTVPRPDSGVISLIFCCIRQKMCFSFTQKGKGIMTFTNGHYEMIEMLENKIFRLSRSFPVILTNKTFMLMNFWLPLADFYRFRHRRLGQTVWPTSFFESYHGFSWKVAKYLVFRMFIWAEHTSAELKFPIKLDKTYQISRPAKSGISTPAETALVKIQVRGLIRPALCSSKIFSK